MKRSLFKSGTLRLPGGIVDFYPDYFSPLESDAWFAYLKQHTPWEQETLHLFGKDIPVPRLTAWHGKPGAIYTYSNVEHHPHPWNPTLLRIKRRVEAAAGTSFNSVLLNLYRDGEDSVSWHSDDEPELGSNPFIASVSFGAVRRFHMKHKKDKKVRHAFDLPHGSLLVMRGSTQHYWLHQIRKTARPSGPRINLTFRFLYPPSDR